MPSGNFMVDREDEPVDDEYCSDCKHSPCRCDEVFERSRE